MNTELRTRIGRRERLLGTLVGMPSAEVVEVLATTGLDWLFLDAEHGGIDTAHLAGMLRAAGSCACLVRVPACETPWLARALDAGAAGVIVPQVNDAATARAAVQACRYPPDGRRGAGLGRAQRYGLDARRYVGTANDRVVVVVQVEHADAVRNIDSIVTVPGVDAVFVGPYDLSGSLGHPGELDHPVVRAAVSRVATACAQARMPLGAFAVDADDVRPWLDLGCTLLAVGSDALLLAAATRDCLRRIGEG